MRRAKGEGSYDQLKDGTYRFRITKNGQEHAVEAQSRSLLRSKVSQLKKELEAGLNVKTKTLTLAWWLGRWLDTLNRGTTYRGHEQKVRLYLIETNCAERDVTKPIGDFKAVPFGTLQLKQITSEHVRQVLKELEAPNRAEGKLSAATATGAFRVLRTALNVAIRETPPLLAANPCNSIKRPPIKAKLKRVVEPHDVERFVAHCEGTPKGDALICMMGTGLRDSEMIGLQKTDIDWSLKPPIIRVQHALKLPQYLKDGEDPLGAPKSDAAFREIPIGKIALAAFKRLLSIPSDSPYVVVSELGQPLTHGALYKALQIRLKQLGMSRRGVHDMRKTYATNLARNGAPLHVIHTLLGHSDIKVTIENYVQTMSGDTIATADMALAAPRKKRRVTRDHRTKKPANAGKTGDRRRDARPERDDRVRKLSA